MGVLLTLLVGFLLYEEAVYHLFGYGLRGMNPLYAIMLALAVGGVWSILILAVKGSRKRILFSLFLWATTSWAWAQLLYLHIFEQPLLWRSIAQGGQAASVYFGRELMTGLLRALPGLILAMAPSIALEVTLGLGKWRLPGFSLLPLLRGSTLTAAGVCGAWIVMGLGSTMDLSFYKDYAYFCDPLTVGETLGMLPLAERDIRQEITLLARELLEKSSQRDNMVMAERVIP